MKKEVVCILDDWYEAKRGQGQCPNELPKKDEIYFVIEDYVNEMGVRVYVLVGWEECEFQAISFADITNESKEMVQQINKALKAPSPDWQEHKLSPTEKEWMKGFNYHLTDARRYFLIPEILKGKWKL